MFVRQSVEHFAIEHNGSIKRASKKACNETVLMAFICRRLSLLSTRSSLPIRLPTVSPFSTSSPDKMTFSHIFQHCSKHRDTAGGRQSHARMVASGFIPTTFVANCLIHMYVTCSNLEYAHKVFVRMPHMDIVSWNAMISGHARNGTLDVAKSLFDRMPERDVISWNSMISGFLQNGELNESIGLFLHMLQSGINPDRTTIAVILKSCAALEEVDMGTQIHGFVIKMGLDCDVVTGSALIDMYAKCKRLDESIYLFDEMPERNWVCWSALIAGCTQNEQYAVALELFLEMQRCGVGQCQSAYASVFRSCAGLSSERIGRQLHGHALKNNYSTDVVVGTAIMDMYAKCDILDDARRLFQLLPMRNLQCWNAIIVGLVRNGQGNDAIGLFKCMNHSGVGFNEISLSGVCSACAEVKRYLMGLQAHCLALKTGTIYNVCVGNAVLDMYGKCEALEEAYNVFEEMEQRDAVSWNAVIAALEQNGRYEEALLHFYQMLHYGMQPDEFTYGSVLKACAGLQSSVCGVKVHNKVIKSGLGLVSFVGSALVDMYCKCGMMGEAQKLHDRIEKQNLVSANAIISGFTLQKQSEEAQNFFSKMLNNSIEPDHFTYATVLDTCANIATIGLGMQIHAKIIKLELHKDVFISSTLVDMYAKCGNMNDSYLMFKKMIDRDLVSWNAMICGYAHHGHGLKALKIFDRMQLENVRPNHTTFLAVLRACGHVGLFDEGMSYFSLMTDHYQLEPRLEHYSCVVDIIGRGKGVSEALELIVKMPFEADDVMWRTLLSLCKIHKNVEVAEIAAKKLMMLDPEDSSSCILLSNIYANAGRWEEVSRMRRIMKESKLKKEPGCSWIEIKNEMHTFLVGDKAHPKCNEIYERLDELIAEMMWAGYLPDLETFVEDEKGERKDQLELLAVGCG
ncbi:pentatricopeptide repeat-containing protein At3g02330, mitochondrial-like [Zingiber officinale]|nr:pentatricopeptide repeat-containing protein At3g02330, mitochondrial-like [Zingiber officinale]